MKTYRTPWEVRLAPQSNYTAKCPDAGDHDDEMTLSFESDSGHEYELECRVFVEFEPAQNGGRTDPSWPASFHSPVAYWFRRGYGWKEVALTSNQEDQIIEHFGDAAGDDGGCDDGPEYDKYDRYDYRY